MLRTWGRNWKVGEVLDRVAEDLEAVVGVAGFAAGPAGVAGRAVQTQRRAEALNAATRDLNRRIRDALHRGTGIDLAEHPRKWWDWWRDTWYDYYELEKPTTDAYSRPVWETGVSLSWYHPLQPRPPSSICFARGTPVWTRTGKAAIETIKVGDCVLAQDPRSGELAYKPVLATTTRNPAARVRIALGSETITATRGHPFWVSGEGWKMAKELKPGGRLHAVAGTATIDGVEDLPPAKPWEDSGDTTSYNLIVDGFHTFFVGQHRLLVHDNTLFPMDGPVGPVPGMLMP